MTRDVAAAAAGPAGGPAGAAVPAPRRAAGRVASGADAHHVHLISRAGDAAPWRTSCPAGGAGGNRGRQATPSLELIDCDGCYRLEPALVQVVNGLVGDQLAELARARGLVEAFLAWAATDGGIDGGIDGGFDGGGVLLAAYIGSARLYPVRPDERDKLIARWLEARRRYP